MLAYLLAACIGLAALAISLSLAMKRLRETGEMLEKGAARKQAQSDRVRRLARACLQLRRDLDAAQRRKTAIDQSCVDLEERLKTVGVERNRLIVFDDRRTKADAGWVVHMTNPDFASKVNSGVDPLALDAWRKGRRFVVWALDENKAQEKISARFSPKRGFNITKVEKFTR